MAATKIIVPDFAFSGTYYADILRRLRIFNRINAPEITSEVAEEPFIQLERAFALVGHLNNVLLDLAANEVLLPTLKLQDSARLLLKLIDYQLNDYSPATVDLLVELPQTLTSSQTILETDSLFETARDEDAEAIPFEVLSAVTVGPTNVVDAAYVLSVPLRGTPPGTDPSTGSDGATLVGDSDAFESATANFTSSDINREIEILGSLLGNNGVYKIVEIITTTRVRLGGTLGNDDPNFIAETGLDWTVREFGADVSADLNAASTPVSLWTTPVAGDKFYFGSEHVLWSEFDVVMDTNGSGIDGVWEYYDPDIEDETPDSVSNQGTYLRVGVNAILGTDNRAGALVRVTYLQTGVSEVLQSVWSGGANYVDTTAFLGQTGTPSTDVDDYAVGSDWLPLENQNDGTTDFSGDGKVEYDFPQTERRDWSKVTVVNTEGYFLRFRIVLVSTPTTPIVDTVDITGGTQYVVVEAVQGETITNESLASSNGQEDQTFELSRTPGLRDTVEVYVDEGGGEVQWTNLTALGSTLLMSGTKDRHFEVDQNALGKLTVKFGDGTRGKIPTLGVDNIRFEYRINATDNGNVGTGTVTVNTGGSSFVKSVTNPRSGSGWRIADGADDDSLALVKEQGPASLRTLHRACSPADYEDLSEQFETSSGTRPIVRALAIEEGFGPKTVKIVVVGTNGVTIPSSARDELEVYFNGDDALGTEGVGLVNTEATVVSFTPRIITLNVTVEANSAVTADMISTRLATLLNPTAQESSGSYVWKFGGKVPTSRIASEIFQVSPGNIFDVDVNTPASDLELADEELPLLDTSALVINIVAPS